jgi:uncharacterized membrane protein YkoI
MKKIGIAQRIAAAVCAFTIVSPSAAFAQTTPRASRPAAVAYQFRMDDLACGYQYHDEGLIPADCAKAIDTALKHAGFTWDEAEIDDIYVFVTPTYDEPVVEVEFEVRDVDYDYIVGANTLRIYQWLIDQ